MKADAQPSVFEGLPRTLLDAMYMGKAIVATDINGNREAIQHEVNGLLVPSESADDLRNAILQLLRDFDARREFSLKATEAANLRFSMERQLVHLEQVIVGVHK